MMIATWYAIVSFMLITYIALDGRNFGAGMLHWVVAKTPEERRQLIAAIGPLWTWHEVWLVAFGGTLLAIFPRLLASAFAGYYLALFLILWCFILRGISIEVGGHINDRLWQGFWDFVFMFSNFLLAILFGAAAGNVARGVPLDAQGNFSMAFFTNFRTHGYVGLLDWYTVSIAIFATVILAAHGATYLTLKTEGAVHCRSSRLAKYLWMVVVPTVSDAQMLRSPFKQSRWFTRVGYLVVPYHSSTTIATNGQRLSGGTAKASNNMTLTFEAGYEITRDISVSVTSGIPPKPHITGEGAAASLGVLGKVRYGPAFLTGYYRFPNTGRFRPYVGGGAAYAIIFKEFDGSVKNLQVHNNFGTVLQGGVEYEVNSKYTLFMDFKEVWLAVNAHGVLSDGTEVKARVKLNPSLITVGVKFHLPFGSGR